MRTFLGVPIRIKGKAIGNLYLTDKLPERGGDGALPIPFSDEDEQIVEMFAAQAAIAIENAQLYRKTQQLAILQERERFGMDLHDGIIQSIYAVGLMLEEAQHRLKYDPKAADVEIRKGLTGLNEVIRDIRNYILDLRPERFQGRDLKHGIDELVRDLKANSFLNVRLSDENVDISRLSPEETVEILHIVQEALTNIRKHAKAVHVDIDMIMVDGRFEARISDDGVGLDERVAESTRGNGIRNMKERAAMIGGELIVAPAATGTVVRLILPSLSRS
jgi:signal transduction histidine kinase